MHYTRIVGLSHKWTIEKLRTATAIKSPVGIRSVKNTRDNLRVVSYCLGVHICYKSLQPVSMAEKLSNDMNGEIGLKRFNFVSTFTCHSFLKISGLSNFINTKLF